ncbi:WD repeat-containing protein YMR102C-like isoform X2 [Primulina eburnea]
MSFASVDFILSFTAKASAHCLEAELKVLAFEEGFRFFHGLNSRIMDSFRKDTKESRFFYALEHIKPEPDFESDFEGTLSPFHRTRDSSSQGVDIDDKYSLDGQYLANDGRDKLVKVWRVVEDERLSAMDIPDVDPSCMYFSMNQHSELRPLVVAKDEVKCKTWQKTTESACIILPPKIFRILETPLHVFQGHSGEILDLSWSQNNCLLPSSVDRTVCFCWLGVDQCLKVFQHGDYV